MAYDSGKVRGDHRRSAVIAFTHCEHLRIMFRFSRNEEAPSCLGSRIVASYFDLPTTDPSETFPNSQSRSRSIWTSIARVWGACARSPLIRRPDVVVDMFPRKWPGEEEQADFKIVMANVDYNDLVKDLRPLQSMSEADADGLPAFPTMDYADLIHAGVPITLGRGESEVVQLPGDRDSFYVFKGVTLASALIDGTTEYAKRLCYNEIQTVLNMPPHPNIKGPPEFYVTTTRYEPKRESVICGTLYPFMKNGSLAEAIKKQLKLPKPIWSLHTLAKWCFQLASAVEHSHFEAGTYHMDLKPSNILLDDNEDLIVIDWEQGGATIYMRAPEINYTMHVREVKDSSGSKTLVYKPYKTPPIPDSGDNMKKWNHDCPKAVEKAEVYALGKTMWMLLARIDEGQAYHIWKKNPEKVLWRLKSQHDVSQDWKDIIRRCVCEDPNKRIDLKELSDFWEMTERRLEKEREYWEKMERTWKIEEMEGMIVGLESVALL